MSPGIVGELAVTVHVDTRGQYIKAPKCSRVLDSDSQELRVFCEVKSLNHTKLRILIKAATMARGCRRWRSRRIWTPVANIALAWWLCSQQQTPVGLNFVFYAKPVAWGFRGPTPGSPWDGKQGPWTGERREVVDGGRPLVHRFREAGELNLICSQAVKSKKHIPIQVMLATGESLTVSVDSASTSREVCVHIAHKQGLSDHLGFSLQVAVYDKVLARHPARHPPPSYTQGGHPEAQALSPCQPGHRLPSQPPGTGRCTHTHAHSKQPVLPHSRGHLAAAPQPQQCRVHTWSPPSGHAQTSGTHTSLLLQTPSGPGAVDTLAANMEGHTSTDPHRPHRHPQFHTLRLRHTPVCQPGHPRPSHIGQTHVCLLREGAAGRAMGRGRQAIAVWRSPSAVYMGSAVSTQPVLGSKGPRPRPSPAHADGGHPRGVGIPWDGTCNNS